MREIAWIEREGGGPVRVRDRVRIDNTIIKPGGVDRFEFEFEFGSTTQLSSRGGWTGSSSSSSSDRHTIIEPGGWTGSSSSSSSDRQHNPPTPADARGSAPGNNDRSARTQSFGAELNGLKPWRRGGFRCFWEAGKLLAGCWWKLFGRLVSGGRC